MDSQITSLSDFRLPDYPDAALRLNGSLLSVIDPSPLTPEASEIITPAIGLAAVLYRWHPNALAAFLELDAWFSSSSVISTTALAWSLGEPGGDIGGVARPDIRSSGVR